MQIDKSGADVIVTNGREKAVVERDVLDFRADALLASRKQVRRWSYRAQIRVGFIIRYAEAIHFSFRASSVAALSLDDIDERPDFAKCIYHRIVSRFRAILIVKRLTQCGRISIGVARCAHSGTTSGKNEGSQHRR
ncbi:MAG: hypothetical protein JJ970_03545 [Erythrobacter sp.]|uniref:hypothetical protein n=1 Tax=Erythrobacter sp. TaxID=1042 RepID=UPI001B0CE318|nr:hypothetical protein [Erythrobacter sp.]MBO6529095.1 hypothetical protein [Erythrobacter sp.]